jgi:crotonobetaine/carnitine-CoA ligase
MALPLSHVNDQSLSTLMSLNAGTTLVLVEVFSGSGFIDQVRDHDATITVCIGTQIRAMLAQPERETDADNDLRDIITAISVTPEEKERFEERSDAPLLNGYRLSETMTVVSVAPYHGDQRWPSIGRPAFDREVYVVDDDGEPLPSGETGEIAVDGRRGGNLMQEYYQMPERTAGTFTEEGWLSTGDYGGSTGRVTSASLTGRRTALRPAARSQRSRGRGRSGTPRRRQGGRRRRRAARGLRRGREGLREARRGPAERRGGARTRG